MPRWCAYEVPVDTGLFTPLHLQPTAVCRLAFDAAGRWLSRHAISHRRLVAEHRTGLVLWSVRLVSGDPVGFFDADRLGVRVTGRVRGAGTQLECDVEVSGVRPGMTARDSVARCPSLAADAEDRSTACSSTGERGPEAAVARMGCIGAKDPSAVSAGPLGPVGRATRLQACCIPLRLDGGPALSGTPARLCPEVMSAFLADEIEARPHRSPLPSLRAAIAAGGATLARARTPFVIHRHQCEVADQWFWPEAVSLAGSGREEVVRAEAELVPRLRLAMRTPVGRLDLLFRRPFYLFDEGAVLSVAYDWEGRLAFVHELVGTGGGGDEPRALAIEQFAPGPEPVWD